MLLGSGEHGGEWVLVEVVGHEMEVGRTMVSS